jgi:hypothetical protein
MPLFGRMVWVHLNCDDRQRLSKTETDSDTIYRVRSDLKDEIASTRLDVALLWTEMTERLGPMQAEMADTHQEIAVLQVDVRKDGTPLHRGMARLE